MLASISIQNQRFSHTRENQNWGEVSLAFSTSNAFGLWNSRGTLLIFVPIDARNGLFNEIFHVSSVVWAEAYYSFNVGSVIWYRVFPNSWSVLKIGLDASTADNMEQEVKYLQKKLVHSHFNLGTWILEPLKNFAKVLQVNMDCAIQNDAIILMEDFASPC